MAATNLGRKYQEKSTVPGMQVPSAELAAAASHDAQSPGACKATTFPQPRGCSPRSPPWAGAAAGAAWPAFLSRKPWASCRWAHTFLPPKPPSDCNTFQNALSWMVAEKHPFPGLIVIHMKMFPITWEYRAAQDCAPSHFMFGSGYLEDGSNSSAWQG